MLPVRATARSRRLSLHASRALPAMVLALAVVGCGDARAAPDPAPAAARPATQFGAHVGAGCNGIAAMPAFEAFAGRRLERTVDAFDQRSWDHYRRSIPWISNCWKGHPIALTLSVPMMPQKTDATLARGAAGAYDDVFLLAARSMVRDGLGNATVRIGWEFNGNWMPWRAAADPAAYIAYFRRIVRLMRSVPGQRFCFEWTPNVGKQELAPDLAYPGDDVVDVIGMDIYNEYWSPALALPKVRFAWLMSQPYGLKWHRDFAARHGKPTSYPEWGSGTRPDGHGAGDDPYFIEQMAAWFAEARPLYASYWEVFHPGEYDDTVSRGVHPRAAAAFRRAFGGAAADQPAR